MKILFIHQNFPGQFIHLASELAKDTKNEIVALTINSNQEIKGITTRKYKLLRSRSPDTHPLLAEQELQVMRAEACAAAALEIKKNCFQPDLIVAHPGWGEALFMKDVFPKAKILLYCEYYYNLEGQDVGFDPEENQLTFRQRFALRLKNSTNLLSMEIADAAISPTKWQKSTYPLSSQKKISVIHDGIDLKKFKHNPLAKLNIFSNKNNISRSFHNGDDIITYIARNLEPTRGFHVFMRTLPRIMSRCPSAKVIIIGGNEISYGSPPSRDSSWKEKMLREVGGEIDMDRVYFLGQVPYETYINVLNISKTHLYWTTPFVLSWSFLEAYANSLPIIASNTPPVLEFSNRNNINTTDFFDEKSFADLAIEKLRSTAPRKIQVINDETIDLEKCVKKQMKLIREI
ncbi:MAG: glycosyltransferase [Burkholderiaceae bacterium]|nr:glycosyltransferase [Burkholderiaceae bacterium]